MSLEPGTRIGPYEISETLGTGGMGEVYRARDTKLHRDVAIKILPPLFASEPDRLARFEREARILATFNHPNIATLYGVEQHGHLTALVMQYVDGETLATRLSRGALPLAQALDYATQLASALDRAHRASIVHRDLKPGNVMLSRGNAASGSPTVKLLDFGLAKAAALHGLSTFRSAETKTASLTSEGTIVGTLQYMAPEQVEARDVDTRTDIFAFGAVLYEMLTGRRAFEGSSQASVIAAILDREPPPVSTLQPLTPPALDWLVRRCLAKDTEARWQSAADLAAELAWIRTSTPSAAAVLPMPSRLLPWAVAAAVTVLAAVAVWTRREPPAVVPVVHALLSPPTAAAIVPELSPDGRMIAWSAPHPEMESPVFVGSLDADDARPIPGTEGAILAFWSPDGKNVAFFAQGQLKRVPIAGGPPSVICAVTEPSTRGGSWSNRDVIIFSSARRGPLFRVPAAGGTPEPLTTLKKDQIAHTWPVFLPDANHYLYYARGNPGPSDSDMIVFASLDGGETRPILRMPGNVTFADGYLLYSMDGRLVAQPFDPEHGRLHGDVVSIGDGVAPSWGIGRAMFSAAAGTLVTVADQLAWHMSRLRLISPDGTTIGRLPDAVLWGTPRISPDGLRVVSAVADPKTKTVDIWTWDVRTSESKRLTFDGGRYDPVWSADGSRVYYLVDKNAPNGISVAYRSQRILASTALIGASETFVTSLPSGASLSDCSTEYCLLRVWQPQLGTNWDVVAVSLADGKQLSVAASAADEEWSRFSPDGRFVAFSSNKTGTYEIYVTRFPAAAGMWPVSSTTGDYPVWSHNGRVLYYQTWNGEQFFAADVQTSPTFRAGTPRPVFAHTLEGSALGMALLSLSPFPDGTRFLAEFGPGLSTHEYRLIVNWVDSLKRR